MLLKIVKNIYNWARTKYVGKVASDMIFDLEEYKDDTMYLSITHNEMGKPYLKITLDGVDWYFEAHSELPCEYYFPKTYGENKNNE